MEDLFVFHPEYSGKKECILNMDGLVPLITFTAFADFPYLVHAFTTRMGGVSEKEFATLNFSTVRGDTVENVEENYRRVCETLGVKRECLVFTDQVHKTMVSFADGTKTDYSMTDGLVTDQLGVVLSTSYADCVPLYFLDTKHRAVGLSHSGWRGTMEGIGAVTIRKMTELFDSRPQDLIVVIGPSICKDCYEVSLDVVEEFSRTYSNEEVSQFVNDKENGTFKLDLWKANELQLLNSGIQRDNLHVSGLCTCCNHTLLFSHRATLGKRGNLNGFFGIK